MTRILVWIDKEKERVVPVELNEDIAAAMECQFSVEAQWSAALEAAPPHTPVSLPSEEELVQAQWDIRNQLYGKQFMGEFEDLSEEQLEWLYKEARAIRKLLTEKGVG